MITTQTKRNIHKKIAQKELLDFIFYANKLVGIWEKQEIIAQKLNTSIKTPKIKSEEEAKYQQGTVIYRNDSVELMYEEEILYQEYLEIKSKIYRVECFLKTLNVREIELLYYLFEIGFSVKQTAAEMNMSRDGAHRMIRRIYQKLSNFS